MLVDGVDDLGFVVEVLQAHGRDALIIGRVSGLEYLEGLAAARHRPLRWLVGRNVRHLDLQVVQLVQGDQGYHILALVELLGRLAVG